MALISVAQANPNQPKKSTLEKVAMGFDIANGVLGIGLKGAEVYNRFEETGIAKKNLALQETKLGAEIAKDTDVVPEGTPGSFKVDVNGGEYRKWKPSEKKYETYLDSVTTGLVTPYSSAEEADKDLKLGRPVEKWRVEGGQDIWVNTDPTKFNKMFQADLDIKNAQAQKTTAEAAQVGKESTNKKFDTEDAIRKEINQLEPVKAFREAQSILATMDTLIADGSPQAQYAGIVGFVKSLSTGPVTQQEANAAGQGVLSDNIMRELAKAGIETETSVDAQGNPRVLLSEKAFKNIGRIIRNNLEQKKQIIEKDIYPTYRSRAQKQGLDVDNILIPLSIPAAKSGGAKMTREEMIKELGGQ